MPKSSLHMTATCCLQMQRKYPPYLAPQLEMLEVTL
jgi:hypothetical protein